MGCIVSCCASCIATSICTACCNACCRSMETPEDKITPSSGRILSVFILLLSVGASFGFQYGLAPYFVGGEDGLSTSSLLKKQTSVGRHIVQAWTNRCNYTDSSYMTACAGQAGVFRVAFTTIVFFLLSAFFSFFWYTFNARFWPLKFFFYLALLLATIFIYNFPLFDGIVMWFCRIGSIPFIIFQQIILIDTCYNWNENWVYKSDQAMDQGYKWKSYTWLAALLFISFTFIVGSIVAIAFLFLNFGIAYDCTENTVFIAITLVLGILSTLIQLCSADSNSSLLTSSTIFMYATYLCFSSVSKNPKSQCNPNLNSNNAAGIAVGVIITLLTLAWTGWSWTAHARLGSTMDSSMDTKPEYDTNHVRPSRMNSNNDDNNPTPLVVVAPPKNDVMRIAEEEAGGGTLSTPPQQATTSHEKTSFANSYQINIILLLVACWYAVTLTDWGRIPSTDQYVVSAANPSVGTVSMWIIIVSQWIMFLLYIWSLIAPKVFPNRDFN